MDLIDVRKLFVQLSGRADLMDAVTFEDYGSDNFIREGSKFLDRKMTTSNEEDSIFISVISGDFKAQFQTARVIKEVWFYDTDTRYQLEEVTKGRLKEMFSSILSSDASGIPAKYATVRCATVSGTAPADFLSSANLAYNDINGVIFSPLDRSGTLEIVGKFYSKVLSLNTDENYWSVNYPMLLVWAALYHLEISYRNSEGSKDWLASITHHLSEIEMDHVEQDAYNLTQLGGREND